MLSTNTHKHDNNVLEFNLETIRTKYKTKAIISWIFLDVCSIISAIYSSAWRSWLFWAHKLFTWTERRANHAGRYKSSTAGSGESHRAVPPTGERVPRPKYDTTYINTSSNSLSITVPIEKYMGICVVCVCVCVCMSVCTYLTIFWGQICTQKSDKVSKNLPL